MTRRDSAIETFNNTRINNCVIIKFHYIICFIKIRFTIKVVQAEKIKFLKEAKTFLV